MGNPALVQTKRRSETIQDLLLLYEQVKLVMNTEVDNKHQVRSSIGFGNGVVAKYLNKATLGSSLSLCPLTQHNP